MVKRTKTVNARIRHISVLVFCLILLVTTPGCWDRREVEDLGIVLGLAIDIDPESEDENTLKITAQFVSPHGLGRSNSMEKQGSKPFYNLNRSGENIIKILSDFNVVSSRVPNYEHLKIIIIGREVAEENSLYELMHTLLAFQEIPRNTFVVVSDCEAASLLEEESELESMPAYEIDNLLRHNQATSKKLYRQSIGDLFKEFSAGRSFAVQRIIREDTIVMEGAAVFRGEDNKMAGFLDALETEGLNWLTGEAKFAAVQIKDEEQGGNLTCTMSISKHQIKAMTEDGDLSFRVNIWAEGLLMESWTLNQNIEDPEILMEIESRISEQIKLAIETALRVLQKEYKADVAGFCKELRIEDIHLWEELMDDWDNTFSETPIEVVVDYHITGYQRRTSR